MKYPYELFGVECWAGWKCLVWPLMRRCRLEGVNISQIKEKYGGLRFYVDSASDSLHAAIDDAEELSYTICEKCGDPGHPRREYLNCGWIKTLCNECHERD